MTKSPFFRYGSVILFAFCLFRFLWWTFPDLSTIWDLQVEDHIQRFSYEKQSPSPSTPYIVHIDLDDQSVATLPYDPNDPRLYSELIRILNEAGVKTILIDMVFPYCREGRETLCDAFSREVVKAENVYLPVILADNVPPDKEKTNISMSQFGAWNISNSDAIQLKQGKISLSNLPALNDGAAGLGHINSPPDRDGVYRRLPLFINSNNGLIPSLALQVACGYLKVSPDQVRIQNGQNLELSGAQFPDGRSGDITIPVDNQARHRINFSGSWNDSFSHYSFATIINTGSTLNGLMNLTDELEDSLAIVSDVSTGSRDFGPIPLSSYFPLSGMFSHFINSVLEGDFLHVADGLTLLRLDGVLLILLTIASVYLRGNRFCIAAGVLVGGLIAGSVYLFMAQRFLVPLVRPSMSLITAIPAILLLQFIQEQKEKQYIRGQLTHYFSPSLMDKILKEPELLNNVEKKELTVLFSDIVGFTSWSSTKDAQEIHQTLSHYFEEMAAIVFTYQGTIDKYMGDGLMVFFGDPVSCGNHAQLAVQAAIAMQKKTRELRTEWERSGGMPITIRIGVHTGEVIVGNMGSKSRMEYTVIGSNVNLTQRLESNCEPGGVMFSEKTFKNLDKSFDVEPVGTIQAKGFSEPIPVYTVRGI